MMSHLLHGNGMDCGREHGEWRVSFERPLPVPSARIIASFFFFRPVFLPHHSSLPGGQVPQPRPHPSVRLI